MIGPKIGAIGLAMFGVGAILMMVVQNERVSNFFRGTMVLGACMLLLSWAIFIWRLGS